MGSFLWTDIFEYAYPDYSNVRSFVRWKSKLLMDNRPFMLFTQDIIISSVVKNKLKQ